ncbi:MAG: DNA gyrase inhibitor YacG [Polyangiaceae bacterium]
MLIICPECGTRMEVPADHVPRPFCSTRCKLIDLGRWLNEEIRLPVSPEAVTTENPGRDPEN